MWCGICGDIARQIGGCHRSYADTSRVICADFVDHMRCYHPPCSEMSGDTCVRITREWAKTHLPGGRMSGISIATLDVHRGDVMRDVHGTRRPHARISRVSLAEKRGQSEVLRPGGATHRNLSAQNSLWPLFSRRVWRRLPERRSGPCGPDRCYTPIAGTSQGGIPWTVRPPLPRCCRRWPPWPNAS